MFWGLSVSGPVDNVGWLAILYEGVCLTFGGFSGALGASSLLFGT